MASTLKLYTTRVPGRPVEDGEISLTEVKMPIRKITEVDTFAPEETELLVSAFESTLLELNLDRSDPLARSIAKQMITVLRDGERDPEKLSATALEAVGLGPTKAA